MYNIRMDAPNALDLFLPPVQRWFRATLGEPTVPQQFGKKRKKEGRGNHATMTTHITSSIDGSESRTTKWSVRSLNECGSRE